jgi:glutamine synthetase
LKGAPFEACSRGILKKQTAAAAALGYRFNLGIETEFFVLKQDEDGRLAPTSAGDTLAKPCYDVRGFLDNYGMLDEIVQAMNGLGWDVYSFDHEDANGQFETDFQYADALTMADRFTFFRLMVGEFAKRRGHIATFMAKPFADRTGSGAHFNMSMASLETGENLFEAEADANGLKLSKLGYQFVAGVLRHAHAISAVIAKGISEKEHAALLAHFRSPTHTSSAQRIADALGYRSYASVNSLYARLSRRVAEQLGVLQKPPEGFWLFVLAGWAEEREPETGHTQFVLRAPVVRALERLGFATQPDVATNEPIAARPH